MPGRVLHLGHQRVDLSRSAPGVGRVGAEVQADGVEQPAPGAHVGQHGDGARRDASRCARPPGPARPGRAAWPGHRGNPGAGTGPGRGGGRTRPGGGPSPHRPRPGRAAAWPPGSGTSGVGPGPKRLWRSTPSYTALRRPLGSRSGQVAGARSRSTPPTASSTGYRAGGVATPGALTTPPPWPGTSPPHYVPRPRESRSPSRRRRTRCAGCR